MKTFDSMKNELFHINREIKTLFDAAGELPGISSLPFDEWEKNERFHRGASR